MCILNTFRELPEPVLTTELTTRFEEVGALPEVAQQAEELYELIDQLPSCNQVLLAWVVLHFSAVAENEKYNKLNAQVKPLLKTTHRTSNYKNFFFFSSSIVIGCFIVTSSSDVTPINDHNPLSC